MPAICAFVGSFENNFNFKAIICGAFYFIKKKKISFILFCYWGYVVRVGV